MRGALLRGREHHTQGWLEVVGDGAVAAAISLGGAPKRYAHADPNEDAAGIGTGASGHLILAADAHDGFEASEVLVGHLLENPGPHWCDEGLGTTPDAWSRHAIAALCAQRL